MASYPSIAQLAKMDANARIGRLYGVPKAARDRLILEAAKLMADIVNSEETQ